MLGKAKKTRKKQFRPHKSMEELANISHLNSIYDEIHHTNKGITYGRALVRKTA